MSIVFDLERTNQLNLLPDKDLVDLCPPIEPYQVTKNQTKYPFLNHAQIPQPRYPTAATRLRRVYLAHFSTRNSATCSSANQ
ncbi:MAG: hypothetical protein EWV86_10830 [Microcystis panniformis Mp_MB_F_20051200_S9D]|nr:MAG: hypothetical protein EWV86_10830 [Microcystis panniformis Mp_MB_F_20051200_S9D]